MYTKGLKVKVRKRAEPSTTITIRVPTRLLPKIKKMEGRSRSDKVKRLIEKAAQAKSL